MKSKWMIRAIIGLSALLLWACSPDDNALTVTEQKATIKKCKVAVLMEAEEQALWERTASWALHNIKEAQRDLPYRVELQLVFKNQDADNINDVMQQIAEDTTIVAIVGPTSTAKARQMATVLNKRKAYHKPMITPTATGVDYQRTFAATDFVWNLSECDIAQLEVILSNCASITNSESSPITLLAPDITDEKGINDFTDWFGFIAEEYGLPIANVLLYKSADDVRRYVHQLFTTNYMDLKGPLIFNPSNADMAIAFDDEVGKMKAAAAASNKKIYQPHILCTDAFVSDRTAATCRNATYEGVDISANPESGFITAYKQHFGEEPINGEAQLYDALCLVAYAATLQHNTGQSLNSAIQSVVNGRDGAGASWLPADMAHNFQSLSEGRTPDIDGVSNSWTFDTKNQAGIVESTYRRWRLYNGAFLTLEYISTDGAYRSTSSQKIWEWKSTRDQEFNADEGANRTYPPLRDHWALLIAASKGWLNCRFQSDIFAMYQLLKAHGYTDDHIVLICEDDVAYNKSNPQPGNLFINENGANVYDSTAIDYRLNTLSPDDIGDILQGKRSERLPEVIQATDHDNIFIYWSSHGARGWLDFGGMQSMSYSKMRQILTNTPHRKMLFAVEACFGGGLGEDGSGLPGILYITAANRNEQSHADVWSEKYGVYLSNGFTRGFLEAIHQNPTITLRNLYYTVARNTIGSHVRMYNMEQYGSVYNNDMGEFLKK